MITCETYNEMTVDDFRRLFRERFPEGNVAVLELMASNPARSVGASMGRIAYDVDRRPIAIQGLLPRRAYFGQTAVKVGQAMVMAVAKDVDRGFLTPFLKETIESSGEDMVFGNTAIPGSRKRLQSAVNVQDGPASCSLIRERSLRGNGLFARLLRKLHKLAGGDVAAPRSVIAPYQAKEDGLMLSRETKIDQRDFNGFWERYLRTNKGLVSSRMADELRWVFAQGLERGEVVLLTAWRNDVLVGYVFCRRTDETAACWRIVDMIAIENDKSVLEKLIGAVSTLLRSQTPAMCLQVTGFPMWVQPLLERLFPKSVSFGYNKCIWAYLNDKTRTLCGDWISSEKGWYGGPYDGDLCLV